MTNASITGVGITQFEHTSDHSLTALAELAATNALDDADMSPEEVTSFHVGNMAAEVFNRRAGLANALAASIGAFGASADRIENTSASGASALVRAVEAIQAGVSEVALVVGVEQMSEADTATATDVISRLTHEWEWAHGLTLPSFGGLAATVYLDRYDVPREALAHVSVKNHANAARNPYAQFQKEITVAEALDSRLVAEPLRLFDCCPTSDGAAALVLTSEVDENAVAVASAVSATGTSPRAPSSMAAPCSRSRGTTSISPGTKHRCWAFSLTPRGSRRTHSVLGVLLPARSC